MLKRLQLHSLRGWLRYKLYRPYAIKYWIRDIKSAHERCAYCGWYLHPQLIFKGITHHSYGKIGEDFVCKNCFRLRNLD